MMIQWLVQRKVLHAREKVCFVSSLFYVLAYVYKDFFMLSHSCLCTVVLKHMPLSPGALPPFVCGSA